MSTKTTHAKEGTDPRPDYILAGTDQEGTDHLYWTTDETILVIREDGIEHREALGGRHVDAWMAYVDDERGWASRRLHATFGDALAAALDS